MNHYANKQKYLERIFSSKVSIEESQIRILETGSSYPIVDNVIICDSAIVEAAKDIQTSFGDEWKAFNFISDEHQEEFDSYFDLVKIDNLDGKVVCDLGCGMGRWASIMLQRTSPDIMICVDFSEAIYDCQHNLAEYDNTIFIKADILAHPFAEDFCDFMYCLGVLHHTTTPALQVVRHLRPCSPEFLVYLYYSLDNRSSSFKALFYVADKLRKIMCLIKSHRFRLLSSYAIALLIYRPLVTIGGLFELFGHGNKVPLFEFYRNKAIRRLAQDAYDRFFTSIEQRVSKDQIAALEDTYRVVTISNAVPFWHFLLQR